MGLSAGRKQTETRVPKGDHEVRSTPHRKSLSTLKDPVTSDFYQRRPTKKDTNKAGQGSHPNIPPWKNRKDKTDSESIQEGTGGGTGP